MTDFFDERRPHNGLSYDDYRTNWKQQAGTPPSDPDPSERKMHYFLNYNWDRQDSVHETYKPSDELREAVRAIEEPQLWMVITEPWCGDSAFLLPVIAEAAALNDHIQLRILHRDDNLDIMDQYLTDGSRSIPKLVAFSEDGEEQFTWGPRPDRARERYQELRSVHDDKMKAIEGLIELYDEGAWRDADEELADTIRSVHFAAAS